MKIKEIQEIFDIIENLEKNNEKIDKLVEKILKKNEILELKNKKLLDEVESLWNMMDEIEKSDIENFTKIFEDLEKDMLIRTLMMSKKKVLA